MEPTLPWYEDSPDKLKGVSYYFKPSLGDVYPKSEMDLRKESLAEELSLTSNPTPWEGLLEDANTYIPLTAEETIQHLYQMVQQLRPRVSWEELETVMSEIGNTNTNN